MFLKIIFTIFLTFVFSGCSHRFGNKDFFQNGFQGSDEVIYYKDMKLIPVSYSEIFNWKNDNKQDSLKAFVRGCKKNSKINVKDICNLGKVLLETESDNEDITKFFEENFQAYKIFDRYNNKDKGKVTGYYLPILEGSLTKTDKFKYPIYAKPRDFKVPYYTHQEIDQGKIDADVICWVADRIDRFFLHIQGSGVIRLQDGSTIGIGYVAQNGYSYRSIGTYMHRRFKIPLYKLSAQYIKNWLKKYPKYADEVLHHNKSFVFFKKQKSGLALGSMGINLVPQSTIAVDLKYIPIGSPIFITEEKSNDKILNHLFMAQDTGGAIKGVIRADLFFGMGEKAGKLAGTMNRQAYFYILLPLGFDFFD